ncbi:MAG: HutD family protein [Aquamicrobium sp.]|nr:HutD family protein [Aquamicrobium sp.]
MRIIRRDTYRRMPWKNGQGLTEEVAALPEGVVVDGFDWRLSIAHVDGDGPFSLFPGIDRTIALLEGEGLALDLPGGGTVTLSPGGGPFAFPGEWAISSRNLGGPTIDLNIMTRRGRVDHVMRCVALDGGRRIDPEGTTLVVVCVVCAVTGLSAREELSRFDTILLDAGDTVEIEPAAPGFAFEIPLSASR